MFKLLILDIDGVMTDGTKVYDTNSNVIAKCFHDHDFTAIKRFKSENINVCFLSGDRAVNENMAKKRNIDYYYNEKDGHKGNHLKYIRLIYAVKPSEVAYVGDDIYDLGILQMVGYPMCPQNAVKEVKEFCEINGRVIQRDSGYGVISQLYYEVH